MNILKLVLRNIEGSSFRSWVIFICSALVAGFVVAAALVIGGAQKSLRLALERLGADIIVVPVENETKMENAFLMGVPAAIWMPEEVAVQTAAIPGVVAVSPQLYLSTLRGATCCSLPEMFLIAYDPETDFTLKPWLQTHLADGLSRGQAVGGRYVYVPSGQENILIYGYEVDLAGNLDPTGTGIDRTMFFTFETAYEISRLSPFKAERPMEIPEGSVSSLMVKVEPNADVHAVAMAIQEAVPGVTPVESTNLFGTQRAQILGLLRTVVFILAIIWVMALALIGLAFSMAVNERRREIGVLRAMGATRGNVLASLLSEGAFIAAFGGMLGIGLALLAVYLFRNLLIQTMGVPFLLPTPVSILTLAAQGLLLALASVLLAALVPSLRISALDPAVAMRE